MTNELKKITADIGLYEQYAEKYAEHIEELFAVVRGELIGEEYSAAIASSNPSAAISALADYYRKKPKYVAKKRANSGKFDRDKADRTAAGYAREVNIDWHFEGNEIDFLFNPTIKNPPVNHEWLWQFNRQSYWFNLADTYDATADERYAEAFKKQLLKWIGQTFAPEKHNNPGSAWRTIECGLRLLGSWPAAYESFKNSPCIDDVTLVLMIASMHRQSVHLVKNATKANWLLMEMNGVYTFTSLFPELSDSDEARAFAQERMLREIVEQILPDGMHYELSPDYHSVATSTAQNFILLAKAFGRDSEIPESFMKTWERAIENPIAMSTPSFTQPRTNDCFTMQTARFAGYGKAVFGERPEYEFVLSERERGYIPWEFTSKEFPYAGFVVMRSDWSADATYLCFDVGPLGKGHMHQDKLNINIYKGDEELLFDDGGGQYEESEARWYALSGYDHNTVLVDGLPEKRKMPEKLDEPNDAHFITRSDFDYAMGEYTDTFGKSFDSLSSPASWRREVAFFKPDFFLVVDTLSSADTAPHDYELLFQLDTTNYELPSEYKNALIGKFGRKYDLLLLPLDGEGEVSLTAISGQTEPCLRGWYNGRNDKELHAALTVGREVKGKKNFKFATLIFPLAEGDEMPSVSRQGSLVTVNFKGAEKKFDIDALDTYK